VEADEGRLGVERFRLGPFEADYRVQRDEHRRARALRLPRALVRARGAFGVRLRAALRLALLEDARVVLDRRCAQRLLQRELAAGRLRARGVVDGHVVVEGGRDLRAVGRPCERDRCQTVVEQSLLTFERDESGAARREQSLTATRLPLVLLARERGKMFSVGRPGELEVDETFARGE